MLLVVRRVVEVMTLVVSRVVHLRSLIMMMFRVTKGHVVVWKVSLLTLKFCLTSVVGMLKVCTCVLDCCWVPWLTLVVIEMGLVTLILRQHDSGLKLFRLNFLWREVVKNIC